MIDAKVAVDKATDYLKIFFPESERTQLIEVELSDDKKSWYITMSHDTLPTTPSELMASAKTTKYKVFRIDVKSGEVISMKLRDLKL
ncbi:hypothetical protein ACFLRR_02070 [Bacteroidota bacterium]